MHTELRQVFDFVGFAYQYIKVIHQVLRVSKTKVSKFGRLRAGGLPDVNLSTATFMVRQKLSYIQLLSETLWSNHFQSPRLV